LEAADSNSATSSVIPSGSLVTAQRKSSAMRRSSTRPSWVSSTSPRLRSTTRNWKSTAMPTAINTNEANVRLNKTSISV